uniref:Putative secreted protein n=1 Tax=Panstrongylus lignarius TaxID=156445 RepID=A0A224Y1F1_9HEMI
MQPTAIFGFLFSVPLINSSNTISCFSISMYIKANCVASSLVLAFGAPTHFCTKPFITSPEVFPAEAQFSTKAKAASKPFSCAGALLSTTNFFTKLKYLFHSGDFSSSICRKRFVAASYPLTRAFHIL